MIIYLQGFYGFINFGKSYFFSEEMRELCYYNDRIIIICEIWEDRPFVWKNCIEEFIICRTITDWFLYINICFDGLLLYKSESEHQCFLGILSNLILSCFFTIHHIGNTLIISKEYFLTLWRELRKCSSLGFRNIFRSLYFRHI